MSASTQGFHLAAAAAALALSASAFSADAPLGASGKAISAGDKVHCYGVHSCKGNADCKTTEHACKAQNSCKGSGLKDSPDGECLTEGGSISAR